MNVCFNSCSCNSSIIIARGTCSEHSKDWEARIDVTAIQEMLKRMAEIEKVLTLLLTEKQRKWWEIWR